MSRFGWLTGLFVVSLLVSGGFVYAHVLGWWFILCLILVYSFLVFLGVVTVNWQFFMPITCSFPEAKKQVVISFDDGPEPQTKEILALLEKYKATANFFCIGEQLVAYPELAQEIHANGHFMGNHSNSHTALFPMKTKSEIVSELKTTNQYIEEITGRACHFFRPPFGVTNPTIAMAVRALNMHAIGWSIRSFDTTDMEGRRALARVTKNLESGDVILLHDHSPKILLVLEELLGYLEQHNFGTARIDTLWNKQ